MTENLNPEQETPEWLQNNLVTRFEVWEIDEQTYELNFVYTLPKTSTGSGTAGLTFSTKNPKTHTFEWAYFFPYGEDEDDIGISQRSGLGTLAEAVVLSCIKDNYPEEELTKSIIFHSHASEARRNQLLSMGIEIGEQYTFEDYYERCLLRAQEKGFKIGKIEKTPTQTTESTVTYEYKFPFDPTTPSEDIPNITKEDLERLIRKLRGEED